MLSAGSPGTCYVSQWKTKYRKEYGWCSVSAIEARNIREWRLLALIGYCRYHVRGSQIKRRKYQTDIYDLSSATLRLDREQINNHNDTTQ